MSIKEEISQLASDPNKAKVLSAQMIIAHRKGTDPIIIVNNRKIKLTRSRSISKTIASSN